MPECYDAMSYRCCLRVLVSILRVFESLPGVFVSAYVILFSLLLGNTMRMRGNVV